MSAEETLGGKAKPAERYFAAWFGMASGSAASFAGTRSGKRFPKKNGRKNGTDWKAFSEDRELAQGLFRRNPIRKTIPKEKRTEKRNR